MRPLIVAGLALLLGCPLCAAETPARKDPVERAWDLLSLPWVRAFPMARTLRDQLMIALFPRYPYRDGRPGYLVVVPAFRDDRRFRLWGGRIAADVGGGSAPRGSLDARIDSTFRVGAEVRVESVRAGVGDGGLAVGTYRLAQGSHASARVGAGMRWCTGRSPGVGIAGTLGIDLFPARPWVVGLEGDLGTIGLRGAGGARVRVGRLVRAVEFHLGAAIDTHPEFRGLFAGVGYWF